MKTSTIAIESTVGTDYCVAGLRAKALADNRLSIEFTGEVAVVDELGANYDLDKIKALTGSGLAWARRVIGLDAGIAIEVSELTGQLKRSREMGVTYAIAVAIATSLEASGADLLIEGDNWRIRENEVERLKVE